MGIRRRLTCWCTGAALVVTLASCSGSEAPTAEPVAACDRSRQAAAAGADRTVSDEPVLAIVRSPNAPAILARFHPLSLEPASRRVVVGEYHDAWALSPDGSRLALGVSASGENKRTGILIVALDSMRVVQKIETGIAAETLAWLAPRALAAILQRGGTVLVNPLTAKVVKTWPDLVEPYAAASTPERLMMLVPGRAPEAPERTAPMELVVVVAAGPPKRLLLERSRIELDSANQAGLAVNPTHEHAYVFTPGAPVADVDLDEMSVSYHRLRLPLEGPTRTEPTSDVLWRERNALSLGEEEIAVFGSDYTPADDGDFTPVPVGATLVDTVGWTSCLLDPKAGGTVLAAGRLLTFGSGGPSDRGLRIYTVDGRRAFQLLDSDVVWDVNVGGDRAYVQTPDALHVIDVRLGKILKTIVPPPELADVIEAS
jgi:hypothetical protein